MLPCTVALRLRRHAPGAVLENPQLPEPMNGRRYHLHPGAALWSVAVLLVGVSLVMAGCVRTEAPHDPLASGKASYEAYCASCHGDGHGLGQLVSDLKTLPADLTELALRNQGVFPVEAVYQTIDGRKMVPEHGTREMPIWGNIWGYKDDTPVPQEVLDQRINELVEYIRSIQESS